MTKRILSVVAVASVLALFTPLTVTTSAAEMNCRIPFSFIANGTTLPPGSYTLSTNDSVLWVRGHDKTVAVLTNNALSLSDRGMNAVFEKIGDRYELIEAWTGGGAGRELVRARKSADRKAALLKAPIERVVIAGM